MKVRLTMEFDIPESHYKDEEADKDIKPNDLLKHEMGFIKQFIFSGFIGHCKGSHLCHAMDWMVSDSPNKQEYVDSHREWIRILDEAEKTAILEPDPAIALQDFKRRFDEMMANVTDEELVAFLPPWVVK